MLFSSPIFFAFFSFYFAVHYFISHSSRLYFILFGSAFFYAYWNPYYLWLPVFLTLISYFGARWLDGKSVLTRKARLGIITTLLLSPLIFYKYTDFLASLFVGLVGLPAVKLVNLRLPLGISFMSFTLIAYLVDVYRKKFPLELNFAKLLGSVLFFPHLIAGPIVRPSQLIPSIARPISLNRIPYRFGLTLFTWGLFKKLVFADPVAAVVDKIYSSQGQIGFAEAALVLYGFTLQIYCDFSGYTDMALGLARMLGIKLPTNFNRPYTALNIVDFWKRWHITLSTWLRDYLYIPLGGNRFGKVAQIRNLIITMALGGLWHGANLTFLFWGLFHGIGISLVHLFSRVTLPKFISRLITIHFVAVGWVFFRASSFSDALRIFSGFLHPMKQNVFTENPLVLLLLLLFPLMHWWDSHSRLRLSLRKLPPVFFIPVVLFFWLVSIALSAGNSAQFIYFEF